MRVHAQLEDMELTLTFGRTGWSLKVFNLQLEVSGEVQVSTTEAGVIMALALGVGEEGELQEQVVEKLYAVSEPVMRSLQKIATEPKMVEYIEHCLNCKLRYLKNVPNETFKVDESKVENALRIIP